MSFGFSAGDFLAVARLVNDIIDALRSSSVSEFRELTVELENASRALHAIEHLRPEPGQENAINGIKIAALLCKHPLEEFAIKLKKYEALGRSDLSKKDQMRRWRLKLQWGLTMEEEVQRIRIVLSAHMASLNARLGTQGLISASIAARGIDGFHDKLAITHNDVLHIGRETQIQKTAIQQSNSFLQNIARIVQHGVLPQLAALLDIANRIWQSNMQVLDLLVRLQETAPNPDMHHTFFQKPCIFEDALGRVIPVPAEYDLEMLRALISARFSTGPGHEKVLAREYDIFKTCDTTQMLSESEFYGFVPGMKITMAFLIGRYQCGKLERCGRPGCKARKFTKVRAGGQTCSECEIWFDVARVSLPRPSRPDLTQDAFRKVWAERKWFKNVKICPLRIPRLLPFWSEIMRHEYTSCLMGREGVAVQAIIEVSQILYIEVEELKELAGDKILGLDPLQQWDITFRLEDLGMNPPRTTPGHLESFIKDLINDYGYCFDEKQYSWRSGRWSPSLISYTTYSARMLKSALPSDARWTRGGTRGIDR